MRGCPSGICVVGILSGQCGLHVFCFRDQHSVFGRVHVGWACAEQVLVDGGGRVNVWLEPILIF